MSNDITIADIGMPTGVALRDPEVILEEAGERAKALTSMVERTQAFTQIGPSKHLRVEAWITVGQFYGCSARTTQTEECSFNGVFGFKAHARVTHDATGQILTEAEALCMQDEKNWDNKPLHQLMSMAQTRAISKALAMKFRWVVTLGGFAPTPAEEMTGMEQPTNQQASAQKPKAKTPPAPRVPYGNFKDKHIDDPAVPLAELQYLANSTEKGLDDPKRAKFKAQNQAFLVALDTEIARRTNTAAPGQVPAGQAKESTRGPMPDATWAEFEALAMEKYSAAVQTVLASIGLVDLAQVKPEERWTCFDKINAEVGTQH